MKIESLLTFYVGNKFIGSHFPILVVAGDNTWKETPFGEHYIFMDVPNLPFLRRRDTYSPEDTNTEYFDYETYPQFFSAQSLLINQFTAARAHLEYSLSILDRKAYMQIFWEGRAFEFVECDEMPLIRYKVFGKYLKELQTMFNGTRSKKLEEMKAKFSKLPKLKTTEELIKNFRE